MHLQQSLLSSEGTKWSSIEELCHGCLRHLAQSKETRVPALLEQKNQLVWAQPAECRERKGTFSRRLNRLGGMKICIGLNINKYFDRDPSRVYLTGHLLDLHILATTSIFCPVPISGWVSLVYWRVPLLFKKHPVLCAFDNPEERMAHHSHQQLLLHLLRDERFVSFSPGRGLGMRNNFKALTSMLYLHYYHTNLFLWKNRPGTLKPVLNLYFNACTLHCNMGYREMWAKCICLFGLAGHYLEPNR